MPSHIARWSTAALLAVTISLPGAALAQADMSAISGSVEQPRRHFRLRNPADLGTARATEIYQTIRSALATGYESAGYAPVSHYQQWRRYNSAPYPSATHGNHRLTNYANSIAAEDYGSGRTLPVGSVLAKDSFAVTSSGEILLGPLFVMEKMPPGFNPGAGNWRYAMVMPDGSLFGETQGTGAERVEYCIGCHLATEQTDHLYFIPKDYRQP